MLALGEGWVYNEDERGGFITFGDDTAKYRSIPQFKHNRAHRRNVGIRNPLVILEDYQQIQEGLLDDVARG